jgi:hypothetical protein
MLLGQVCVPPVPTTMVRYIGPSGVGVREDGSPRVRAGQPGA